MESLTIGAVIKGGIQRGIKNLIPVVINSLLWILTVWIPYLNVGTTIGLQVGLITKMSKGDTISPTEIFNAQYRDKMGEFFLVTGFMAMGVGVGLAFGIIPGIVIAISWMLAPILVIDKNENAAEAIRKSNELTKGKKWTIFLSLLLIYLCSGIVLFVLITIFGKIPKIGGLFKLILGIGGSAFIVSFVLSAISVIYEKVYN